MNLKTLICDLHFKEKNLASADDFGDTPLHLAAKNGHIDICKLIIGNVGMKHPFNDNGKTPKDLVNKQKFPELYELFKS